MRGHGGAVSLRTGKQNGIMAVCQNCHTHTWEGEAKVAATPCPEEEELKAKVEVQVRFVDKKPWQQQGDLQRWIKAKEQRVADLSQQEEDAVQCAQ